MPNKRTQHDMTVLQLYFLLLHTVTDANARSWSNLKPLRSLAISSHLQVRGDSINVQTIECFIVGGCEVEVKMCCVVTLSSVIPFSRRFYSHCEGYEPTLLLIRTTDGDVSNMHSNRNLSNDSNTQERIKECNNLVKGFALDITP